MNPKPLRPITRRTFFAASAAAIAAASANASKAPTVGSTGRIRIGLLGPGRHGTELLRAMDLLGREHDAEVVAIHRNSLDAVLHTKIDGVIIATPDHLHASLSVAALEAGLHVYCASPLAQTASDAAKVRDAARASDCVYQLGGECVFEPSWRAARALVKSGTIGDVRWCSGSANAPDQLLPGSRGWKTDASRTHGHAAHALHELWSACAYITGAGEPISVSSMGGAFAVDAVLPDALALSADFEHGLHFNLDCNPARRGPVSTTIRGSRGSLVVERNRILAQPETLGGAELQEVWRNDGQRPQTALAEWLTCIRSGDECTCSATLGYGAAVGIARAMDAYRAMAA